MICVTVMIPASFHMFRCYKLMKAKEVLKARDTYMKSFIYVLMTGACTFSAVSIDNKHNITTKATEYEKFYEHIYEKITPDDKV